MSLQPHPLVSIGIPTYNRAGTFLRQALESALAQTYGNIEIIVSDNHSTDETPAVVQEYRDDRIRYFRQDPAIAPNDNFNFCLSQAKGEWFLLLPDDDLIDRDFVESCLAQAEVDTRLGVIRAGVRIINASGTVLKEKRNDVVGLSTGDFFLAWFAGKTSLYLCATLLNTTALREIGGLRSRHNLFQDVMATARLVARLGRLDIPAVKASARWHGGKWTYVGRVGQWCEDSRDLLDLLCELAPDRVREIRERGERFFANINYSRAGDIRSPGQRMVAYLMVYRFFGRRYRPAARMLFRSTALYRALRRAKRRILGMPAWID